MTTTVYLHPNALLTQRFPTPATVPHQPDHYRGLGIPELEVELVLAPELVLVSELVSELVSVSVSELVLVSVSVLVLVSELVLAPALVLTPVLSP